MTTTPVRPVAYMTGRDKFLLLVRSVDYTAALQQIDQALRSESYQKEKDTANDILYGRGSKAGRILGGAFSSRQEFRVITDRDGDLVLLCVQGTATVASAGAIGISKMRKELARLGALIMSRFAPCPDPQDVAPEDLGRFGDVLARRPAGRESEYALVIVVMLIVALVAGLTAAWVVINR